MARSYRKVQKFAEGGYVDPDDRRRYRKMTKEEEESMGPPDTAIQRFMTTIAGKINSYKKEDLRNKDPVAGLGPRG